MWTTIHFCCVVFSVVLLVSPVCAPGNVLIAVSEPQVCRSQCCQRSPWLSFAVRTQLFWQPSGASWPPAAVSLSSPVNDLWPEAGGGGGPWVAFLALEVEDASPGGRGRWGGVGENISGKRQTYISVSVCVCAYVCDAHWYCHL